MKTKNFFALLALLLLSVTANAQMFVVDDDYDQNNPLDCDALSSSNGTNFADLGGNYLSNMDETIVFCPDPTMGSKVSISFGTNIGYEFDVDGSDTIYIYDGPNTSAPLLGAFNSDTDPLGPYVAASFDNNPSGCLTVRFVSDGANEGTGWLAKVSCGDLPQPFTPHLEAFINDHTTNDLSPIDTGYVNVCLGDSVLLVAKPDFPYSFENTQTGYSQTAENAHYSWTIGGQGSLGIDNDSVWFVPQGHQGYFVDLRITDIFPQSERITCKVRVSQLPHFTGTGPLEDTVCMGLSTQLIGGVTATDTVGVEVPEGTFNVGGTYAGLTPLPDGSGSLYQTTINMTGLGNGTVTSVDDIASICLNIEHSFIGDLEIALTCPNGTMISLMNTFSGNGLFPGGCGGGGIELGNDTDQDGGAPGSPVWTYCFSEVNATTGSICDNLGSTIINTAGFSAIDPGQVYAPDGTFADFIGCPLEGDWTISVQDNQSIDDGYIFQWGILFDADLYPDPETYQNVIVADFWSPDPTIIGGGGATDTLLIVVPTQSGPHNYTYNVTDDFGCHYDTTVVLYTIPQPVIFPDTLACWYTYYVSGTQAFDGGVWSASDTAVHFSSLTDPNPTITASVAGTYTVTFTDNACGTSISSDIEFVPYVYTQLLDTSICEGSSYVVNSWQQPGITSYLWNTGETGPSITINGPGNYSVIVSNICHQHTDTATISTKVCDILAPNVIILSSTNGNDKFQVDYQGVQTFECTIMNRWGNVIYEFTDPAGTWDGTANGTKVEDGVYFYVIRATMESGEELTKQGFVQVYR